MTAIDCIIIHHIEKMNSLTQVKHAGLLSQYNLGRFNQY